MGETQFARSLKAFAAAFDRRAALRALSAAGLALLPSRGVPDSGDAKKKKGKNKKKCKGGTKKCGKTCIPATNCCVDADCDGGACVDGVWDCLSGSKPCDGACIPEEHCCTVDDCDDGNPCTASTCNANGTCSHPNRPDLSYCGGNNYCSGGVCATPPSCLHDAPCVNPAPCCSNICLPTGPVGTCLPFSNPSQPCLFSHYCVDSTCVGFVCTK